MIRYALKEEKNELYQMWKETFAFDGDAFTDFYFEHYYDLGKHFILDEEGIVSIASAFTSPYNINGKLLNASMIVGVITQEDKRHQGKMKCLLEEILDQCAHQELVTFIQAYNPNVYASFGFEVLYYRSLYHFHKDEFRWFLKREVEVDPSGEDLLQAYGKFTRHFHGYKVRTAQDFERLKKQYEYEGGGTAALYRNERICAYIFYYVFEDRIVIDECIYHDFKALCALISYCMQMNKQVDLYVSGNEKLYRFFKNVNYEIQDYTMARINNYALFNELFNSDVTEVHEAFSLSEKPLYMREVL